MIALKLPSSPICYLLLAVVVSLFVRCLLSAFQAMEGPIRNFGKAFWITFRGYDTQKFDRDDYWTSFVLGFLEASVYPVLLTLNKPEYIGGWLVLKTIPQWRLWTKHRIFYNHFLIGNAVVVISSFFFGSSFLQLSLTHGCSDSRWHRSGTPPRLEHYHLADGLVLGQAVKVKIDVLKSFGLDSVVQKIYKMLQHKAAFLRPIPL